MIMGFHPASDHVFAQELIISFWSFMPSTSSKYVYTMHLSLEVQSSGAQETPSTARVGFVRGRHDVAATAEAATIRRANEIILPYHPDIAREVLTSRTSNTACGIARSARGQISRVGRVRGVTGLLRESWARRRAKAEGVGTRGAGEELTFSLGTAP